MESNRDRKKRKKDIARSHRDARFFRWPSFHHHHQTCLTLPTYPAHLKHAPIQQRCYHRLLPQRPLIIFLKFLSGTEEILPPRSSSFDSSGAGSPLCAAA
jgi:hypothetical protein